MAKLVVISQPFAGLSYQLGRRWVTIGRNPTSDFQINETSVSGSHCEVLFRGRDLLVRDMRSTNGTFIQNTMVSEGVLGLGGILRLGDMEVRLEGLAVSFPPANDKPQHGDGKSGPVSSSTSNGKAAARKHRVLLVDDSMSFLEVAGEIFDALAGGEWEIHRACGADQALKLMQATAIELAVLDINMPMLDGQQLLIMLRKRHPDVKFVVLTSSATETLRAQCLAAGADLFLEKPATRDGMQFVFNVLKDLLTWKSREGFSGTLQHVCLADIIQIECLRRNTCILQIDAGQPRGEIFIESGTLVHAVAGEFFGEQALHHLLSLNNGRFDLRPFRTPLERTLHGSWECLLLESARLRDEERGGSDDDQTTFITRRLAEAKHSVPPETNNCASEKQFDMPELGNSVVVVSTYDGQWHPADGQ
jgi:CheY-like chemotaxis protein